MYDGVFLLCSLMSTYGGISELVRHLLKPGVFAFSCQSPFFRLTLSKSSACGGILKVWFQLFVYSVLEKCIPCCFHSLLYEKRLQSISSSAPAGRWSSAKLIENCKLFLSLS